jgi:hypothetical protein
MMQSFLPAPDSKSSNAKSEFPATPETSDRTRQSDAIKAARVLCICCVVYVHAWIGLSNAELARSGELATRLLIYLTRTFLGRSSVPLLSIVSGWLVMTTAMRTSYAEFIKIKLRSLLLPMALWNMIGLAVVFGAGFFGFFQDIAPHGFWAFVNEIVPIYQPGAINVQNYFLRDLFMCMVAAPFLVRMRDTYLILIMVASAIVFIIHFPVYVLLRPEILLFFIFGIGIRRHGIKVLNIVRYDKFLLIGLPTALGWQIILFYQYLHNIESTAFGHAVEILCRFYVGFLFLRLCVSLASSRYMPALRVLEPNIFFLFCSHALFLRMLGPVLAKVTGEFGSVGFIFLYISEPLIALAAALVALSMARTISPRFAAALSGNRRTRQDNHRSNLPLTAEAATKANPAK